MFDWVGLFMGCSIPAGCFSLCVGTVVAIVRAFQEMNAELRQFEHRDQALCPACLSVGQSQVVCRTCERPHTVRLLAAQPGAAPAARTSSPSRSHRAKTICPFCLSVLRDPAGHDPAGYCLRCERCKTDMLPQALTRRLIVIGALLASDFDFVWEAAERQPPPQLEVDDASGGPRRLMWVRGDEQFCLLDLSELPEPPERLPDWHAVHRLSRVWTRGADVSQLALAQALDALVRRTGCGADSHQPLLLRVGSPALDAVTLALLRRTLPVVRLGVSPEALLGVLDMTPELAAAPDSPAGSA